MSKLGLPLVDRSTAPTSMVKFPISALAMESAERPTAMRYVRIMMKM